MEKITFVSFHILVDLLFLVRSRCSPLRLLTNEKQSAQQSNEICSESNDRIGLNKGLLWENVGGNQKNLQRFSENVGVFSKQLPLNLGSKQIQFDIPHLISIATNKTKGDKTHYLASRTNTF